MRLAPVIALLLLFAAACVKAPANRDLVDAVELEAADPNEPSTIIDSDELLDRLATAETSHFLWFVVEYEVFDENVLARDLERIERFYRARGYYEAKVTAARVFRVETGEAKVRVEIRVREGAPVITRSVSIPGLEHLPFDVATKALRARQLEPGQPFDEARFEDTKKAIAEALADSGHAFVKVTGKARVDVSKREAVALFQVEPGPLASYGPIRIEGLKQIPEDRVRGNLLIEEGELYSHADLKEARDALITLDVFAAVDVVEDTSKPESRTVPITVRVRESALRAVRLGGGARADNIRLENHLRAGWENRNFLGGLRRFSIEARPGVNYFPASVSNLRMPTRLLWENRLRAELRQPSFIEGRTTGIVAAEYNLYPLLYELPKDVDPEDERIIGYHEIRAQLGLERAFFGHHLYVVPSYNWQANFAFTYQQDLPAALEDPVVVSFPELLFALDYRDDKLHPKKGFYVSNSVQFAFAIDKDKLPLAGTVSDVRVSPELRLYHSVLRKKVTLAARGTLGLLFPFDYGETLGESATLAAKAQQDDVIRDQHKLLFRAFYSGGANSNRGYPYRGVGPHGPIGFLVRTGLNCVVDADNDGVADNAAACTRPLGGLTLWEASFEVRFPVSGAFSMVTFVDSSDVTRNVGEFRFDTPHVSVGPGARYDTPVGPIRLDIGYRVPGLQKLGAAELPEGAGTDNAEKNPDPLFGIAGLNIAIHLAFGEAF